MYMTAKRLEIFVIVVIIAVIGLIYAFTQKPVLAPTNGDANEQIVASDKVEYQGVDGKSALELLKQYHNAEIKSYSFGDMVVGIDGKVPDDKHFWAMYINDQFSQVGASQYITKNSDTIKWQMDEIKF
jgi:hypothetical protein